jgi:hypothetical protein
VVLGEAPVEFFDLLWREWDIGLIEAVPKVSNQLKALGRTELQDLIFERFVHFLRIVSAPPHRNAYPNPFNSPGSA